MGAELVAGTGAVPDGVLLRAGEHGGCLAELAVGGQRRCAARSVRKMPAGGYTAGPSGP